jgi:hypothetical protein
MMITVSSGATNTCELDGTGVWVQASRTTAYFVLNIFCKYLFPLVALKVQNSHMQLVGRPLLNIPLIAQLAHMHHINFTLNPSLGRSSNPGTSNIFFLSM